MHTDKLKAEIVNLIASKREGDYWDFKQKHHTNNSDLLHDIICMANNRADRDEIGIALNKMLSDFRNLNYK